MNTTQHEVGTKVRFEVRGRIKNGIVTGHEADRSGNWVVIQSGKTEWRVISHQVSAR